jgi:hypothetical protein
MIERISPRLTDGISPGLVDRVNLLPPGVSPVPRPIIPLPPAPAPPSAPQPAPSAPQTPATPPSAVPLAPGSSPFDSLPYPNAGDRIKAEDFKKLSQALKIIADLATLTATLFGHTFGDVKLALTSQGYQITHVMSVFGAEIADLNDPSLDTRRLLQVLPARLGSRELMLVVTEAVDTRRFAPNLFGLTYADTQEHVQALVGDVQTGGQPPSAPSLLGLTLAQTERLIAS